MNDGTCYIGFENPGRVVFDEITEGGRSGQRVAGYNAWVELTQCRGSVVLKLSLDCEIEDAYTKDACAVPGLKSY